jgi:hypothetical protein
MLARLDTIPARNGASKEEAMRPSRRQFLRFAAAGIAALPAARIAARKHIR